ncbi:MAG TPA: undecaprenyl-diphosphatase UppP [Dehalococcoidia bacterium]|nr:undecaprenyl-diphosphatase UppP [Dehalococcoidia bacterium]
MTLIRAFILGIVQGLTEFLPISSSGHLVLLPAALGWDSPTLVFDATVHLATLIAVIAVFWRDVGTLIVAWWKGLWGWQPMKTVESRIAWWIVVGTIPGVLAGVFLESTFESFFSEPRAVGGFLLATALLLVLADILGRYRRGFTDITWWDGLIIGIGQAASISPGLSRSGTTISVGVFCGLSREAAARFSFILAIPIILGAGLANLVELFESGNVSAEAPALVMGFFTAAISGYAAIRFLLAYLRKRRLYPFAIYCVLIGILAIAFL